MNPEILLEQLQDPTCYADLGDEELCGLTYFGIGLYGKTNQADLIRVLIPLYHVFRVRIDADERLNLYRAIQNELLKQDISVNALLPFMLEETDFGIVSTAGLDYAVCRPLDDNDPMSGPKEIIGMIVNGRSDCRAGLFGGLLLLGDRRVNKLLWPVKDDLTEQEIQRVVKSRSGFLYAATIDFYLEWLESLDGNFLDTNFGSVASGLVLAREKLMVDKVIESERSFPVDPNSSPSIIHAQYEIDEYAERIADRLLALEAKEPTPKVMPDVLRAWRIPGFGMH